MEGDLLNDRLVQWGDRLVASKKLPSIATQVWHQGTKVHTSLCGFSDVEAGKRLTGDELYVMASCTKIATSIAALQLYERGLFELHDHVSRYIPSFHHPPQVLNAQGTLEDARSRITMLHLFTHTSGLTYPFMTRTAHGDINLVAAKYTEEKVYGGKDLEEVVNKLATMPLVSHPGEDWNYGMSIDVLGRVVEVISGQTIDVYLKENIFVPLRMNDTCFLQRLDPAMESRLHKGYAVLPDDASALVKTYHNGQMFGLPDPFTDLLNLGRPNGDMRQGFMEPGGGLVSTLDDFGRFAQCLCNGGSLDGQRVLGSRTVDFMAMDHLPRSCRWG
jgi:CubicO group peptidase (beta-lactamase class C family)